MDRQDKIPDNPQPPRDFSRERKLLMRLVMRTTIVLAGVFVVLLIGVGLVIDHAYVERNEVVMRHEVSNMKSIIESIMEAPSKLKRDRVEAYLNGMSGNAQMANIRVFSTDTVIAFSSDTLEVGRKLDLTVEDGCSDCHANDLKLAEGERIYAGVNGERLYHFTRPMVNRKVCQECHDAGDVIRGIIVTDFSLSELDTSIASTRRLLIILLSIVFVLLVASILIWLRRSLYRPLLGIAERLSAIASGDFLSEPNSSKISNRIGVNDNVLGVLNEHIEKMSVDLQGSYERLETAVTERTQSLRHSQTELLAEKDKLKLIFDNSPEAIIGVSEDGTVQFANERVAQHVGLRVPKIIGSMVNDSAVLSQIVGGDVVSRAWRQSGGADSVSGVESYLDAEEIEKIFEVQARIINPEGEEPMLLVMFVDGTIKRKVEENLQRHERLASLGQLAAGVAHEVGNPLSAISSVAQLMRTNPNPETTSHNLDLISYHIKRISGIVRGLSDFARRPTDEIIEVRISTIVSDALEITTYDHRAKNVRFSHDFAKEEKILSVPRDQLMQAMLNIMMNALDATSDVEDPVIKVVTKQTNNEMTIIVSDNGCGMSSDTKRHIFEPFYTTKGEGKGTGLGMFITHRIITQMGGSLNVESSVGVGTTFTIVLDTDKLNTNKLNIEKSS